MARPLIDLTKLDVPFVWGIRQEAAFEQLRIALVTGPVLCFPRPEGKYILDTDASLRAIGTVLSQVQDDEERVIAYGNADAPFSSCQRLLWT
jgi:hypothetical protein